MLDQMIEQFLTYAAAADPGFPARLRGASDADIALLESFGDTPLPELYRAFLRTMGEDDGGLNLMAGGTTNIQKLLRVCRFWELDKDDISPPIPPGLILMGLPDTRDDFVAFDCTKPGDPPLLWVNADGKAIDTFAESLMKLMYRSAFSLFVLPRYPASLVLQYYRPPMVLSDALPVADAIGFRKRWFSDLRELCGEADEAVLSLSSWPGRGSMFIIRAMLEERAQDLAQAIESRLGPAHR